MQDENLITPDAVLTKYSKLRGVTKVSTLAVKLAREAFFGKELMRQSTVHGSRDLPALPNEKLMELKAVIQTVLKYTDCEFEQIWKLCEDSIGHACRSLRNPRKSLSSLNK